MSNFEPELREDKHKLIALHTAPHGWLFLFLLKPPLTPRGVAPAMAVFLLTANPRAREASRQAYLKLGWNQRSSLLGRLNEFSHKYSLVSLVTVHNLKLFFHFVIHPEKDSAFFLHWIYGWSWFWDAKMLRPRGIPRSWGKMIHHQDSVVDPVDPCGVLWNGAFPQYDRDYEILWNDWCPP